MSSDTDRHERTRGKPIQLRQLLSPSAPHTIPILAPLALRDPELPGYAARVAIERARKCSKCHGLRANYRCPTCAGSGGTPKEKKTIRFDGSCATCCGTGEAKCQACGGTGTMVPPMRTSPNQYAKQVMMLTAFGEVLTITEWARRTGLKADTIASRLRRGCSDEMALQPVQRGKR